MRRTRLAELPTGAPTFTWTERVLKKRILVHLDTDQSIQGVLMEKVEDGLILRAAKLLGDTDEDGAALAGETFIPHARVVFAQLDE
jgi:hypothetical protein